MKICKDHYELSTNQGCDLSHLWGKWLSKITNLRLWWKRCKSQIRFCTSHGNMLYIFCDSIKQSSYLSFPLGSSSTHLIMASMKSFSLMVTSFRVSFIEMKIKRWYFSICLLRKMNKITSEWWHFSNLSYILLCYLAPSLCSYVLWQLHMKSKYRLLWFGWFMLLMVSPPPSQHCF